MDLISSLLGSIFDILDGLPLIGDLLGDIDILG